MLIIHWILLNETLHGEFSSSLPNYPFKGRVLPKNPMLQKPPSFGEVSAPNPK